MKPHVILTAGLACLALSACDSGDIPETQYAVSSSGRTARLTARVTGVSAWDDSYTVALAAFGDGSNYSIVQRAIPNTTPDSAVIDIVMSGITADATSVELVVTNKLRKRVMTLASTRDIGEDPSDTIRLNLGDIRVDAFGALQNGVFNTACIMCHGGNGYKGADLDLTETASYADLVGVASTRVSGATRVTPGDAESSLLRALLREGGENLIGHNHTEILSSQFKTNLPEAQSLIDYWINHLPAGDSPQGE